MANTTRKCIICGERHDCVDITTYDGTVYTVCEKCASEQFKRSCITGRWVHWPSYATQFCSDYSVWKQRLCRNGLFILADEWRHGGVYNEDGSVTINRGGGWRWCDECGLPNKYLKTVWDEGRERNVCGECFDELYSDYTQCCDCQAYFDPHYDDGYTNADGEYVCCACRDSSWRMCTDCGELYHEDNDRIRYSERRDEYVCDNCWDEACDEDYDSSEESHIHEYSHKPRPKFYSTEEDEDGNTLYLGTENEHSHEDRYELSEHSSYIAYNYNPDNEYESHFYQKSDSSLEYGTEVVSHPMSLSYWHKIRPHMEDVFEQSRRYTSTHDGLHVHVSRNGMNSFHEDVFLMFMEMCRASIELIARRSSDDYAAFYDKFDVTRLKKYGTMEDFLRMLYTHKGSRYRCVNFQNPRTIEVRVFESTLHCSEFYSALEFCHAAYQFTKRAAMTDVFQWGQNNVLWDCFLNYCADDKRYLTLTSWLEKRQPEYWGSTLLDMDEWAELTRAKFDRLDTFLEDMPEPVTGGHVLSRLLLNRDTNTYHDSEDYSRVDQPASILERNMAEAVSHSMHDGWRGSENMDMAASDYE